MAHQSPVYTELELYTLLFLISDLLLSYNLIYQYPVFRLVHQQQDISHPPPPLPPGPGLWVLRASSSPCLTLTVPSEAVHFLHRRIWW